MYKYKKFIYKKFNFNFFSGNRIQNIDIKIINDNKNLDESMKIQSKTSKKNNLNDQIINNEDYCLNINHTGELLYLYFIQIIFY